MRAQSTRASAILRCSVAVGALLLPVSAFAQAAADDDSTEKTEEIIVTGTLIRGTTVVGSQTLSFDSKAIADKGASSTNELLSIVPQIANQFNGRIDGDPRGYSAGISITKPNLRNIPSANTTSGGLTLVLMDGMRLTPVGVNQASPDVDIIPAAVLAGIDVVTDGGSSLYGADAVAGVLNFRTLKSFEGLKVDGNFGFGTTIKGYHVWDGTVTGGKSWSGGNAYISVGHSERDGILNGETKWANGLVYNAAGVASTPFTQCLAPQPTETRWFRYGAGATSFTNNSAAPGAGTFSLGTGCDNITAQSYMPQQKRTNVFAQLSQEFGDNVDLRVTGYWTKRDTELVGYPRGFTSANPGPTTGAQAGALSPGTPVGGLAVFPAGTGFSFGTNAAYVNTPTRIGFETWGITPELTVKLGSDWQVRNTAHFGRSTNYQSFPDVNTIKAQAYINSGQLNPLNAAAASAAVITDITDYENAQDTKQQLFTLRSIADGPLFALPGGDAKLAVGVEYQNNKAESRLTAGSVGSLASLPYMESSRNAKSVFAEISLPVTSFANISGSIRYDHYSDFGSTTNPNIGLVLKPVSWLKIFGHWNTSYNAPTAVDALAIGTGRFVCGIYTVGGTPAQRPTDPLLRDTSKQGTCAMVLQGSSPGLKPQTAESWAVGFEATPWAGVRIGGEFYSIDIKDMLGTLNPSNINTYSTNPDLYTYNVSSADYAAVLATLTNGAALGAQQPASNIAIIVDTRTSNLNAAKIAGVDFHAFYETDTSIGHVALGVSGTYATKARITNGGVTTNELGHASGAVPGNRLSATSFLGWSNGGMSAKATVNYTGKYHDAAVNNLGVSEVVDPFVVVNVNLGYDFKDSGGPLNGTSFRVIVDNLFEASPQTIKRINTNNTTYNNWTLGRVIKLGFSKTF